MQFDKRQEMKYKSKEEIYLDGPRSRQYELGFLLRVMWNFFKGFRAMHFIGPCITVFGSARFKGGHPYYELAELVGGRIAKYGFTTMTGGGPGIMEAANKGAFENGGKSVGCNVKLPFEQHPNPYMHKWITLRYFFIRKVLLLKYSYAFIVLPGGFGTMDELYETLTLVQTGVIRDFPIVLMGKDYYEPMQTFIKRMVEEKTVSENDLKLLLITDDIDEAFHHIDKYITAHFSVKQQKPRWWLGEYRRLSKLE